LPHLLTRPDEEVVLFMTRIPASGSMDLSHEVYQYGVYSSAYVFLSWAWAEAAHVFLQAVGTFPPGDYLATLDQTPWRILLVLRGLSATAGVLSVALLMVFTRREMGAAASLVAGVVLATSFLHVRESHSAKPDALLVLGVVVALGVMAPLARRATLARAAGVGVAIGLAVSMKYPAVLLLVPAWVLCMMGSSASGWRRIVPGTAMVVGGTAALAFFGSSPDVLLNEQTRLRVLSIVALVFPALVSESATQATQPPSVPQGIVGFEHPEGIAAGIQYYFGFALRYGAGLVALVAVPLSFAWAFVSRQPLAVAAGVFGLASVALLGASPAVHSRYLTPIMPAVAIVVAGAIAALGSRWTGAGRFVVAGLTLLFVAEPLGRSIAYDRLIARTDSRVLAARWLEQNVPAGDKAAMLGTVFWGWGEPHVPPGIELVRVAPGLESFRTAGVDWVIAHDHEVFSSRVEPLALEELRPDFELAHRIEVFGGPREATAYDPQDAYYVPMTGFGVVERPGPDVRIYRRRSNS